jgi:hydroxymethylpyrimidine/phosphomethylpyrimidine kinase
MPIVLSIAGFDPSAGAGVLADIKTFAALGAYGMACITALTVQSTQGVSRVECLAPVEIAETLDYLGRDVHFDAIKVGMLGNGRVAMIALEWIRSHPHVPVVLDPVTASSSGAELLDRHGREMLRQEWLAHVAWITPNLPELAALTGNPLPETPKQTEQSAQTLLDHAVALGNPDLTIIVTGGHAARPDDFLLSRMHREWLPGERIVTTSTHGTGCAFSSAIAARLAHRDNPVEAARAAKAYVAGALQNADLIGQGAGPLNHFWNCRQP